MTDRGIIYYLVAGPGGGRGAQHALQFVVSMHSLRQHWDGPIHGVAGDQWASSLFARAASHDPGFSFDTRLKPADAKCYSEKPSAYDWSPFTHTLFLDCDTIVAGDFEELWPKEQESIVLTAFSNWVSSSRKIRNRCAAWSDVAPDLVAASAKRNLPAINTGVFAFQQRADPWFFRQWQSLCQKKPRLFIGDETAAQILAAGMSGEQQLRIVDDRYNLSVKHGHNLHDPRIWHGHGRKFLTTEPGRKLWAPRFAECHREDYLGCRSWTAQYAPRVLQLLESDGFDEAAEPTEGDES